MEYCDHGHQAQEVRRLPYGRKEQGGAVLVCREHYEQEMLARREKGDQELPAWESLKVYTTGEDEPTPKVYRKNGTPAEWQEFIQAMRSGQRIEVDADIYYYFLGVLPPVFSRKWVTYVPGYEGHKMYVDFGFAEGYEEIVLFCSNQQQNRFFCQQSNKINPCA